MMTNMKKTAIVLVCGLLFQAAAFADDFVTGSFMINGGFGIGAGLPHFSPEVEDNSVSLGGRIQADFGIVRFLSLGLETGFVHAKVGSSDFSVGAVPVMARVAWHPFAFKGIDPYLVGKAGYGFGFWTAEGNDYNWSDMGVGGFVWGASLGSRFYFTQNIGVFIEAGYECLDVEWDHPGMELEKWEENFSMRTFGIIGLAVKLGGGEL